MNIAEASIRYKTVTIVFTLLIIGGGALAYEKLGRLEDPEFTIKDAKVFTFYPGASAGEVADEVTDTLETAIQQLGQLDDVTSTSEPGKSTITVSIKDNYDKRRLPQVWDELRRKVNDAQRQLPPGASTSIVYDDFGDVYGVYYAVYGDGFSYQELKEYAKLLRRELLLCDDVAKVDLFADQQEVIYVEISTARLSQLGLSPDVIRNTLAGQNLVAPSGKVVVDSKYIRIEPSGEFASVEDIGNLLIVQDDATASKLYLRDIARVWRGYEDPPSMIMRYNGKPAIGIGISTVEGGNVITMGDSLDRRLAELVEETPIGIEIGVIAHQAQAVNTAVNGFMISLAEAVAIVIGVLMIAMGLRSALLIGFILILTVLATFMVMQAQGVMLERISLGALIIALGMLVDNAIVVVEGIIIGIQRGQGRVEAAVGIVKQTMWPLFGATVVAVLAFAAIGVSQDSTGEYCRSLFLVILYSLMLSWVLAITITPFFGVLFLQAPKVAEGEDPYGGLLFTVYRACLSFAIRARWLTVLILVAMLFASIWGFGFVKNSFFPDSTRPQFMVHFWMPQGTHITETEAELERLENAIRNDLGPVSDELTDVSSFVGGGALRFLLTYAPEEANDSYGMLLVSVKDYTKIMTDIIPAIQTHAEEHFPDAQVFGRAFMLGPGESQKIHCRLRGPDVEVLRELAAQVERYMYETPDAVDIMSDWRQRVPLVRPVVAETQARNAGITRAQIAAALEITFSGEQVGVYREGDELLPIIGRSPADERNDIDQLNRVFIWSPVARKNIPLRQVVLGFESVSDNPIIRRRDRLPCITVKCDPTPGLTAEPVRRAVAQRIDEARAKGGFNLPLGYELVWGGEYEDSTKAQGALMSKLPVFFLLMVLVVVCLFNNIRQPLAIFLTVPLAVIGVTVGLLSTGQPFGFMALLGFLSLTGMLIKNAIVLVDEINAQINSGKPRFSAIVDSGVSRMRPVSMAALTTVLGMIPLLADAFFVAMAVTIMFGLAFATVLTLVVVPVLYAILFRVRNDEVAA